MKKNNTYDVGSGEKRSLLQTLRGRLFKKAIPMAMFAFFGASLVFTKIDVSAETGLPAGDLPEAPAPIETEFSDESFAAGEEKNSAFEPETLNAPVTTGRHYNCLSADEKVLYEAIGKAVSTKTYIPYALMGSKSAMNSRWVVYATGNFVQQYYGNNKTSFSYALSRAQEAIYYDHPNQVEYYMVAAYSYGYIPARNQSVLVFQAYSNDKMFASYDAQIDAKLNSIVAKIKSIGATSTWPAYNELRAYDYYCGSYGLTYDYDALKATGTQSYFHYAHTAYGSLVLGKAVCDGYSLGFELIMSRLGIPAMIVTGMGGSANNMGGHAWNIVNIDGNWYELDTTRDDKDKTKKADHTFFNKTTESYQKGISLGSVMGYHVRNVNQGYMGFKVPQAKGVHWTYPYISGTYISRYKHDPNVWALGITCPARMDVYQGSTFNIGVTFVPANTTTRTVVLTSSNPRVVATNGGMATAVGTGVANITVKSIDGGYKANCTVYVHIPIGAKFNSGNYTYKVTSASTVSFAGSGKVGTVEIPSTVALNGKIYSVTSIEPGAFKNNKHVLSVKGGKNITSIGSNAFSGCKKLSNVKISGAIRKIGSKAFYKCGKLSKIEFNAKKLNSIGKNAFKGINSSAKFKIKASKSKYNKVIKLVKKAGAKGSYKKG